MVTVSEPTDSRVGPLFGVVCTGVVVVGSVCVIVVVVGNVVVVVVVGGCVDLVVVVVLRFLTTQRKWE